MTFRNHDYRRIDDEELDEFLETLSENRKEFVDCTFDKLLAKEWRNCYFRNCAFDDVRNSNFVNCTFDNCKFYISFKARLSNCNISNHNGILKEGRNLE